MLSNKSHWCKMMYVIIIHSPTNIDYEHRESKAIKLKNIQQTIIIWTKTGKKDDEQRCILSVNFHSVFLPIVLWWIHAAAAEVQSIQIKCRYTKLSLAVNDSDFCMARCQSWPFPLSISQWSSYWLNSDWVGCFIYTGVSHYNHDCVSVHSTKCDVCHWTLLHNICW